MAKEIKLNCNSTRLNKVIVHQTGNSIIDVKRAERTKHYHACAHSNAGKMISYLLMLNICIVMRVSSRMLLILYAAVDLNYCEQSNKVNWMWKPEFFANHSWLRLQLFQSMFINAQKCFRIHFIYAWIFNNISFDSIAQQDSFSFNTKITILLLEWSKTQQSENVWASDARLDNIHQWKFVLKEV